MGIADQKVEVVEIDLASHFTESKKPIKVNPRSSQRVDSKT